MSNCVTDPDTGLEQCDEESASFGNPPPVAQVPPLAQVSPIAQESWQDSSWVQPERTHSRDSLDTWNTMATSWAPTVSATGDIGSTPVQTASSIPSTNTASSAATSAAASSSFAVPNTNHPDGSSNQSASPSTIVPSVTASPSPNATSTGVAAGAVAGIAIAMTLLGAAIAFIAAFFIFKRRQNSTLYKDSRVSTPELMASLKGGGAKHKSYVSISQSIAKPPAVASSVPTAPNGDINLASMSSSSDFLASLLPAAADEITVKNRCATLFNQILHHVEIYYRDVHANMTPSMEKDLARFGSESLNMVEVLQGSSVPTVAIKHALAGFIMSIVSPEGEEQATLFPAELAGLKKSERSKIPGNEAAYIIYKRLAVHLHAPDSASLQSRQSDIREAAEHFALTFFPWANPAIQDQEKDADLVKTISSALEISIWLYGQPYQYEFMWEDPGFRGTAITPGLTKTTDARGRRVGTPEVLLEPIVVGSR